MFKWATQKKEGISEAQQAIQALNDAQNRYNNAEGYASITAAIYELNAAETRVDALTRRKSGEGCICCGDDVPEGRQVCPEREEGVVECKQEETR